MRKKLINFTGDQNIIGVGEIAIDSNGKIHTKTSDLSKVVDFEDKLYIDSEIQKNKPPTIVQTTGTSLTAVMSQTAVTNEILKTKEYVDTAIQTAILNSWNGQY